VPRGTNLDTAFGRRMMIFRGLGSPCGRTLRVPIGRGKKGAVVLNDCREILHLRGRDEPRSSAFAGDGSSPLRVQTVCEKVRQSG